MSSFFTDQVVNEHNFSKQSPAHMCDFINFVSISEDVCKTGRLSENLYRCCERY